MPRFIPAGAGNTFAGAVVVFDKSVYPRWRGEHTKSISAAVAGIGLSPLARGTRDSVLTATINRRFIPAGAGNTFRFLPNIRKYSVYPRWRGEHDRPTTQNNPATGLSPLARGTLQEINNL